MRNAFIKAIANGKPEPIKACMNAASTPRTFMESWLTYSTDHPVSNGGFFYCLCRTHSLPSGVIQTLISG